MSREENLLILRMLQEGTITAEQAAELLSAVSGSATGTASGFFPEASAAPSPPPPPVAVEAPGGAPPPFVESLSAGGDDAYARARAKIAAAREAVAGVQERLAAADEKLEDAPKASNPWQAVADALKDVPGARSVADALRGVDPHRIAVNARRQAKRLGRSVKAQLGDLGEDISAHLPLAGDKRGEPAVTEARELFAVPVAPGGTLRVRNTLGDIEAFGREETTEDNAARVEGTLRVWAVRGDGGQTQAEITAAQVSLLLENGPDGPTVSVRHPADARGISLDLRVHVPAGIKVSLLSPGGDVSAQSVRGAVVLATQGGDALAREVKGDVAAETASGDIGLEGVVGNVFATSASGDIAAARVAGHALRAVTQSGAVRLEQVASTTVTVETVSGDVEARALVGVSLVRARTVSGDIRVAEAAGSGESHLDTVSGQVSFAPQPPLSGLAVITSVSGDMELLLPPPGAGVDGARLEVTTKSGDVRGVVHHGEETRHFDVSGMVTLSEILGNGETSSEEVKNAGRFTLTSVSGDINVNQE